MHKSQLLGKLKQLELKTSLDNIVRTTPNLKVTKTVKSTLNATYNTTGSNLENDHVSYKGAAMTISGHCYIQLLSRRRH
jgi:hypothetical protein